LGNVNPESMEVDRPNGDDDTDMQLDSEDHEQGELEARYGENAQRFNDADDAEDESPVMQCCGILDVEGNTIFVEHKINQTLHGIYLPHTTEQHSSLPTHFPSHLFLHGAHIEDCADDLTRIPNGDAGFANDYEWDYILKAFPKEFPLGSGGFSCPHREGKGMSREEQMRWMMEQSHGKFAEHEVFMFVVFNILQRRKICMGAKLVTRRDNLPRWRLC